MLDPVYVGIFLRSPMSLESQILPYNLSKLWKIYDYRVSEIDRQVTEIDLRVFEIDRRIFEIERRVSENPETRRTISGNCIRA